MAFEKVTDKHLGMYATTKRGYTSGLIGRVEKSKNGVTPYCLRYKSGFSCGINRLDNLEFVEVAEDAEDTRL